YAYTGLDPENENQRKFIDFLAKNGYKPVVKDIRKFGDGRMKANLDIELVVDLFRLADRMDIAVIVSGDGDFAPAIRALQDTGVRCEVVSFKPNTSSDLIAVADEFMDIMKIASISRKERATSGRATGMSAPEMPAKEVTPEFGFREASPAVAAAALAAIKTGGPTNGRPTRGGSRRGAAPSEEPPGEKLPAATATDPSAASAEEGRRRRRRRGGRGRGRSHRDEAPVTEAGGEAATEAVGWEEFDDLSQLDGTEAEREYTFEEADAATLAELGIDPAEVAATEPQAEEKPKRRTRSTTKADGDAAAKPKSRSRSSTAKVADDATAEPQAEEKPKRRTRSTTKADGDAAAKPKSRSRSSTGKVTTNAAESPETTSDSSAQPAADGEEPQGIWGRFRSARGPRPTPTS
ncbi:MAG TPA: NYN domain-containing protein, partial [Allosphingosinicella sp.]|nr:NYN domain-containing protein [Allosphingosinicella sp.]